MAGASTAGSVGLELVVAPFWIPRDIAEEISHLAA